MKKNIFISAGEASGDLHAAELATELIKLSPDCEFYGLGGDKLSALGADIQFHVSDLSTMGFAEVIMKLPFFRRVFSTISKSLEDNPPDAAILIDYPGMSLRSLRFARSIISRACSTVAAIGFSTNRCLPAPKISSAHL